MIGDLLFSFRSQSLKACWEECSAAIGFTNPPQFPQVISGSQFEKLSKSEKLNHVYVVIETARLGMAEFSTDMREAPLTYQKVSLERLLRSRLEIPMRHAINADLAKNGMSVQTMVKEDRLREWSEERQKLEALLLLRFKRYTQSPQFWLRRIQVQA